jgi:Spy/CpxP family protein refolding chaperone
MKKLMFVPAAVVVFLAWFGIADAMMCNGFAGEGMGTAGDHMLVKLKSLGLDAKQMDEVKAVHFSAMKEIIKKRADIKVARIELREILGRDQVDLRAAEAKVRQIEALRGDLRMMRIRALEEVKGKLTREQKIKLQGMDEAMPMMGREMMDGMAGRDGMFGRGGMMSGSYKCGRCGMMGPDYGDDMAPACLGGRTDEMPAAGHRHMQQK